MSYLPLPQVKEVSERFKRIGGYGKESIQRLKHAKLSGALHTPIFFRKLINEEDTNETMTDRELEEEAAEFMITGTDTTSNTLTYLVWVVLRHPEVCRKLEKEISDLPEEYRDSDLTKIKYLNCVVQEALRLYGAASGSHARLVPKGGWMVEDYYLPPFTVVTTQAYSLHRLQEIFPDPFRYITPATYVSRRDNLSLCSFKPERWYNPTPEMQLSYIPFGGGPRSKFPLPEKST